MRDSDEGRLFATATSQAVIEGSEILTLRASSAVGGFDERPAQPDIAFARLAALALARTLVVARTDAGPGGQVVGSGKGREVGADFGDNDLGDALVDAGQLVPKRQFSHKRAHLLLELAIQLGNGFVQIVDV